MKKGLKLLILSDLFIIMGFGLIGPILAIFIKEELIKGSITAVGIAETVFLLTKSLFSIPFGKIEDHHGKKRYLLIGTFLMAFAPLGYYLMTTITHLYIIQFVYGLGAAMAYPSFGVLFLRYLDRGKEAYEWGVYGTVVGIGTAITAFVGAFIAERFAFDYLFLGTFVVCLAGTILLFFIPPEHFKKIKKRISKQ